MDVFGTTITAMITPAKLKMLKTLVCYYSANGSQGTQQLYKKVRENLKNNVSESEPHLIAMLVIKSSQV